MLVFVTVTTLFFDRQITHFLVSPYTVIEQNLSLSPDVSVNHLTNTSQTPLTTVLRHSATMTRIFALYASPNAYCLIVWRTMGSECPENTYLFVFQPNAIPKLNIQLLNSLAENFTRML
jgi:hypothetical protein